MEKEMTITETLNKWKAGRSCTKDNGWKANVLF